MPWRQLALMYFNICRGTLTIYGVVPSAMMWILLKDYNTSDYRQDIKILNKTINSNMHYKCVQNKRQGTIATSKVKVSPQVNNKYFKVKQGP